MALDTQATMSATEEEETVKQQPEESRETEATQETHDTKDTHDTHETQDAEEHQRPPSRDGSDKDTVCLPN